MRKLVVFLCLFSFSTSYAQLERGSQLAGVQLNAMVNDMYYTSFRFGSSGYRKHFGISISPTYGYALQRNWMVGLQATLGFIYTKFDGGGSPYTSKTLDTDFGLAPFTRLYLDITRRGGLKIFASGALEFNIASERIDYPGTPSSTRHFSKTSFKPSLGVGIGWFGQRNSVDLSMGSQAARIGFYRIIQSRKK